MAMLAWGQPADAMGASSVMVWHRQIWLSLMVVMSGLIIVKQVIQEES